MAQEYLDLIFEVEDGKREWDGRWGDMAAMQRDAYEMRRQVQRLERYVSEGDISKAVAQAFWLGRVYEKLVVVRSHEPTAKAGKASKKNLKCEF